MHGVPCLALVAIGTRVFMKWAIIIVMRRERTDRRKHVICLSVVVRTIMIDFVRMLLFSEQFVLYLSEYTLCMITKQDNRVDWFH